jgi:DNA-binding GntR family transcriptional regulator
MAGSGAQQQPMSSMRSTSLKHDVTETAESSVTANPADRIIEAIIAAITSGRLRPGAKLGEEELASLFGVGRAVVRDTLRRLQSQGIIVLRPNRGAFVAEATVEEAEQIYSARRLIECALVSDVAEHCTAADIRSLKAHLERQAELKRSGDRGAYIRSLGDFHVQIARLGSNRLLADLVADLVSRSALLVTLYDSDEHSCELDEHGELIARLAAGDAAGCVALMAEHLQTNERRLRIDRDGPQARPLRDVLCLD